MRGHRLTGPHRTGLVSRVVANGEHEIELGGVGPGKLAPAFRSQVAYVEIQFAQQIDRVPVDLSLRLAPCGECPKNASAGPIEDSFRQDRPRRVSGAEK